MVRPALPAASHSRSNAAPSRMATKKTTAGPAAGRVVFASGRRVRKRAPTSAREAERELPVGDVSQPDLGLERDLGRQVDAAQNAAPKVGVAPPVGVEPVDRESAT